MFKKTVISILIVLLFTNSLAAIGATKLSGKPCQSVGANRTVANIKFTCVKVGKRLLWNSGIRVAEKSKAPAQSPTPTPSATPSPTPTPSATPSPTPTLLTFTPWATDISAATLVKKALEESDKYFLNVRPDKDYLINLEDGLPANDVAWITQILDYVNGAFSNVTKQKAQVFLGASHQWSKKILQEKSLQVGNPSNTYPCSEGYWDAYCAEKNIILLIYSDVWTSNARFTWDIGRKGTPAHEYFHTIQYALSGNGSNIGPGSPTFVPTWLKEGSANYFGFYIANKLGLGSYEEGRRTQVEQNDTYRTNIPLSAYQGYGEVRDGVRLDPYGIGSVATEFIVASSGFESLLKIFEFSRSEGSFEKGFEKATGIGLADFYAKFEQARPKLKIGNRS